MTARTPPGPRSLAATTTKCSSASSRSHVGVSVGQTSGAAQRCRMLNSARELPIRDRQA
jgi:hypothetical protein